MKIEKKNPYQLFNSYCLRTPLFSFSNYLEKIEKQHLLNEDFKELLTKPIFREALFLASPELSKQIEKWEGGSIKDAQKLERLQISILQEFLLVVLLLVYLLHVAWEISVTRQPFN